MVAFCFILMTGTALAAETTRDNVRVTGIAVKELEPDMATINAGVSVTGKTAQEARAKVIEAEAEVPKAMAQAFRDGNLGIMDYQRIKNIESDTNMRESISKPGGQKPEQK